MNRQVFTWITLVGACLAPSSGPAQTRRVEQYLTPPEVVKIIEESETLYRIDTSLDGLAGVNPENTIDTLFPLSTRRFDFPWVVCRDDGAFEVTTFPFDPEAMKALEKAEEHFVRKQYGQAVPYYLEAIRLDPEFYLAYAHLGDCYFMTGQFAVAQGYFDKAIECNPYDHRTFFYRANALRNQGRPEEALADYVHSLSIYPRYPVAMAVLWRCRAELGIAVRKDLFRPRVVVRQDGDAIAVYIGGDEGDVKVWMLYGLTKALWLGEPTHREKMLGESEHNWSSVEEKECLLNLMLTYEGFLDEGTIEPDENLDRLIKILEDGYLNSFILYEIASRLNPHITLIQPEEVREHLREFIRKYVTVPADEAELEAPLNLELQARL
jgi:tetratricopeptide (TPR) repeat protein